MTNGMVRIMNRLNSYTDLAIPQLLDWAIARMTELWGILGRYATRAISRVRVYAMLAPSGNVCKRLKQLSGCFTKASPLFPALLHQLISIPEDNTNQVCSFILTIALIINYQFQCYI